MANAKQLKRDQKKIIRLINLSSDRIEKLNQSLMNLIDFYDEQTDYEMIKLILKLYLCILCNNDELDENDLIDLIINERLFDQLFKIIINCQKKGENLNYLSLIIITLIQNRNNKSNNLFIIKLSLLEQEIALNAYAKVISKQLLDFNQEYRKQFANQASTSNQNGNTMGSLLSALTGLVMTSNQQSNNELIKFDQILNQTDNRCTLLALYDIIHLNRNFIPFLLTNHSNDENKETNNLLINFLEFTSINIVCLREQKNELLQKKLIITLRLCFHILTCIVEDQFANSIIHDSTSKFNIQIHRSKIRHRTISEVNCNSRPIAYAILDLMIEFLCSSLRKNVESFQIDLYVFCNNIILKLLCYQIKFEIRIKEFNWMNLFESLFILIKYLTANYDKDELQSKRKNKLLLLANNVINLFNLTVIFGDTFLHSTDQYDDLYYELLRNHDIFDNLLKLTKHYSLVSKRKDEKEAALKVVSSLDNIELIISHFTSKINETKSDQPLTEDEIREIIRSHYDTLSIKVKDDLDIYENYEPERLFFKKKVIKKIIDQMKITHLNNLDQLINEDQQFIMQSILNC